jgi:hypothetical protein
MAELQAVEVRIILGDGSSMMVTGPGVTAGIGGGRGQSGLGTADDAIDGGAALVRPSDTERDAQIGGLPNGETSRTEGAIVDGGPAPDASAG